MNVCLLNDSFPPMIDGVANVVMNYGRIMQQELGAKVVVATPRYPGADYSAYPYRVIDFPSVDINKLVSGYRMGNPLAMREISELSEFGPQIIHTHCPAVTMLMARILQNETGAPLVFTYHTKYDVDIARAVGEGKLKKEVVKAMVSNISASDEVWVVSRGAGENLKSLGYEGEYRVVSNGVDFVKGRADAAKVKEVTGAFDLPEDVPLFLFVGRIMEYKGLPIIVDAMKLLRDAGMDYRCVFVGGGADAEKMQEKAKEYRLTLDVVKEGGSVETTEGTGCGRILFTGPIHDREALRAWNTRADLFLFPSVYDTNGIVVREAAACGLASVLIQGSCAAEGITDGRNSYTIEENGEAMAALLQRVCKDMDAVHEVGQHAMDEIYISWEESVRDAYARYEELMELWQSGELKRRRKHASDYMLEATAGVAEVTYKASLIPGHLVDGVKENMSGFYEGMMENVAEWKENVRGGIEEIRENLPDSVKDFGSSTKEGVREFGNNAVVVMKEFGATTKEGFREAADGMREFGNNAKESMRELGSNAVEVVKEFGNTAKEGLRDAADGVREFGTNAKEGIRELGQSVRGGDKKDDT